jgi:hypothetical protein
MSMNWQISLGSVMMVLSPVHSFRSVFLKKEQICASNTGGLYKVSGRWARAQGIGQGPRALGKGPGRSVRPKGVEQGPGALGKHSGRSARIWDLP